MNKLKEIEKYFNSLHLQTTMTVYESPGNSVCNILYIQNCPQSWITTDNLEELLKVKFPGVNCSKSFNNLVIYDTVFSC